ncbi:MAG: histidine kinase dimerization/phospho-acceptor domain-containing protein, partial [Saprospiraceae bacterium]|nr:histidine kinase dimerization/phospho-acceptor domain-containing protein [Saprospiraceae bacterium]
MRKWILRNRLYFRITALLVGILGILGVVYVLISGFTARKYLDEFQQQLYGGLADSIVSQVRPFVDGEVDTIAVQDIMHSIMVINPSAEVYLLDTTGSIVTYMAPHKKIKLERVDMAPIRAYLADDRPRIVKGDDPRHPDQSKIFSVAPIEEQDGMAGYLYVILASEDQQRVASSLFESYFFRLGARFFFLALIVALVIGSFAIWYLTKHLTRISATVRRFKEGDLLARIEQPDGDWKELAETFNEMADTINRNITSLKSVESLRRELIANVSHDLRTPLSILRGYIETLKMKTDLSEEERQRYLDIANQSAEKLSRLVTQLFEFSKLEARQIEP